MREEILTKEELEEDNLTQEDNELIEKEMDKAVEDTFDEIEQDIESDEVLKNEVDELFDTDDVDERIEIFNKYHPKDNRFKG